MTPAFVGDAAATGRQVKRTYGSTEAPTVTTTAAGDDPRPAAMTPPAGRLRRRPRATRPHPGELWVRGPELCAGYDDARHQGGVRRERLVPDRRPGVHRRRGWLTVVGRLKDVIIRGGENVSPPRSRRSSRPTRAASGRRRLAGPDGRAGLAFVVADVSASTWTTAGAGSTATASPRSSGPSG